MEEFEKVFLEKKEAEVKFVDLFERLKAVESAKEFESEKEAIRQRYIDDISLKLVRLSKEKELLHMALTEKIREKEALRVEKEDLEGERETNLREVG